MGYLGPKKERITETTLERSLIVSYVKQLFKRPDFPKGVCVALDDGAMAFKGDLVWPYTECEHPFDFVPVARVDELVVNLPSKEAFLQQVGVAKMENVTPEIDAKFWKEFEFELADVAGNVKLTWE